MMVRVICRRSNERNLPSRTREEVMYSRVKMRKRVDLRSGNGGREEVIYLCVMMGKSGSSTLVQWW